jgi:dTDP-4-dehydrorhamnose reductase
MRMEIIVLGHKGMLGNMVVKYFKSCGYEIITTDLRFEFDTYSEWTSFIKGYPEALIINCIGRIKQKTSDTNELLWGNAILPLHLGNIISDKNFLIHPSTDCIFSGKKISAYSIDDVPDAEDVYGWSKYLGEVGVKGKNNTLVVRVSIIGYEITQSKNGLLEWFLSSPKNSELKGFNNHLWNGITTLEWCKKIEEILPELDVYRGKVIQLGTNEQYSKYEMLQLFQKVFKTKHLIQNFTTPEIVNRCLIPTIFSKSLEYQLIDLANYNE